MTPRVFFFFFFQADDGIRALVRSRGRGDVYKRQLFDEGDPSRSFFFVVTGRVKVFRLAPSGREVILEIFGPGDPVGAVGSFEGVPFPAAASAAGASVILEVPRADPYTHLTLPTSHALVIHLSAAPTQTQ